MAQKKIERRGGARPGAGRKVTPYKEILYVRISKEAMDIVNRHASNRSEYIDKLILSSEQ